MMKHSISSVSGRNGILNAVPGDHRKDHEFFESTYSISSSSSSSLDSTISRMSEVTHSNTARNVWDRYTDSNSELRNGSLLVNANSFTKPRSLPTDSKLIATPGSNTSTPSAPELKNSGEGGDISRKEKEVKVDCYEDQKIVETPQYVTNSPIEANIGLMKKLEEKVKKIEKNGRRLFGLSRLEAGVVVMLLIICLVMYIVLLMLTIKAASCSDAIDKYLERRKESYKDLLEANILKINEINHHPGN